MIKKMMLGLVLSFVLIGTQGLAADGPGDNLRIQAQKEYKDGNYKDAFIIYEKLCLDPETGPKRVGSDLVAAVECLRLLKRISDIDDFREKVIKVHGGNWRFLFAAAKTYIHNEHYGYIIAGKFRRGHHRGGGKYVNAFKRDRVRALQLMHAALAAGKGEKDTREFAALHLAFADMILRYNGQDQAWRLQYLTDLSKLPDYDEGRYYGPRANMGAPVDVNGKPVFHRLPESWKEAKSDGERWRWLLNRAVSLDPRVNYSARQKFADFLYHQFGVQTMSSYGRSFYGRQQRDDTKIESGIYALSSLGEDETMARLATGIKRFKLPHEFNFVRIFYEIGNNGKLARIFENRRQYKKAAEFWQKAGNPDRVKRITGNWGVFEPVMTHPSGKGATVDFRFRNAKSVQFKAYRIKTRKLLDDVKDYIKSSPRKFEWRKADISNIGYRIVRENELRYLGDKAAQWSLSLKPRPDHFDKRITVATPLQEAGAYLLAAKTKDGNTSRIIIWINDTVIVKKPLDKGVLFFVADAVSGAPVKKANLEFFGFKRIRRNKLFGYRTEISNFSEYTDVKGQVIFAKKGHSGNRPDAGDPNTVFSDQDLAGDKNWLITATSPSGRLAYLGFTRVWYSNYHDYEYNEHKAFVITDRPVYRPDQTVKFKFWIRHARYDQKDVSLFSNKKFRVRINNPKGEKIFEKGFIADKWGGFDGEYSLPNDAALGLYSVSVPGHGGGRFRVEEYKKPEFEVTVDAPSEPVMLGETITAKIAAKYYFGGPVTNARVKFKVLRYSHRSRWYAPGIWDWFYGPGYWWYAYDYDWYPGWSKWGSSRPVPWWWQVRSTPPEVVMESETLINEDGIVSLKIDTGLAKKLHNDMDHRYEITAEVTDLSRRTIVGRGSVLAARKPFKVYAWLDRGYYRVGDTIKASFKAQTLDNKPVQGKGRIKLLRITYNRNLKPVETVVNTWDTNTGLEGSAQLKIKASGPGQYRLSYTVTDQKGHSIEGGYVFVIRGKGFDGAEFRFNEIELIPDKGEYVPGESVQLMINTNRPGSFVVLFIRPSNGVYPPPKIIAMRGKSIVHEIKVTKKDMPNFFIEAFTIYDGKLHSETREIIVPPEKRVLNLQVEASSPKYKPGERAGISLKLTDFFGKPFVGSTVVSVYDKALEYISGGSNVKDIKAFFWKWRRHHRSQTDTNLYRTFQNLQKEKEEMMRHLGVFGHLVADKGMSDPRGGFSGRLAMSKSLGISKEKHMAAPMSSRMEGSAEMNGPAGMGAVTGDQWGGAKAGEEQLVQPTVRTSFADTAFWNAAVTTNEEGLADVEFTMPENLTGWKIRAWGMGHGTRVGEGSAEVVTAKNLMLRLQAPRFFVQKDEVVLSANVHNYLKNPKKVKVVLDLDGPCLRLMEKAEKRVLIEPDGETRVDWKVAVVREGEAVVRMKALTDEESDAIRMSFPAYVHGMDKMVPYCGVIRPDKNQATIGISVPKKRRVKASRLEIRYSPTLAAAMVDALPYMVNYPYGCTEQTLNRFLPTVITQNILKRMGLKLDEIKKKQTNLNAQEIGDDRDRAGQWKRWNRNPVFDESEVERMVKKSVRRLTSMQLSDGGWGWFSGWGERSYPHTTALVVHGMQLARKNGVAIVPGVLTRGLGWLKSYQNEQVIKLKNGRRDPKKRPWKGHAGHLDAFVYLVLADAGIEDADMHRFLYDDRNKLSVYAKAMFGMALFKQGHVDELNMIMRNIEQYLVEDDENQTAYLNLENGHYWWRWYGSEIEAHAYYLKLLSRVDPKGERASRLVKYLLNNRKHGTYWNSTRDTAISIEALSDYLIASDEDKPDMTIQVLVDGREMKEVHVTTENLFTFDNKLVLSGDRVETGAHTIELRRKGKGPLYYNAYLSYFTLEDYITRAGLELKVQRRYYKLKKTGKTIKVAGSRGQAIDQKVEKYERMPLENLSILKSGDLVEVELVIESKNDYEYIVFEDMKAAGFEPVEIRSGYVRNGLGVYMELRDEKTAFFVRSLPRGRHSLSYRLRAEIPGRFSALPTRAFAMYAPELRANSDEIKLLIEDLSKE